MRQEQKVENSSCFWQAFKQHELHDPLVEPGAADLTADVDFAYLKQCVEGGSMHVFLHLRKQIFLWVYVGEKNFKQHAEL